jgi:hypothetical protein
LEVGVVRGPDPEWSPRVAPFLGHKGLEYRTHIQRALDGPLDELETRFYVGTVEGRIISQIMIVGARGAGILGHVYTRPDERRKGACNLIMGHQMADCRAAGFRVLCLGTGFDSPPYWIYHSHGFRGIAEGSGQMIWNASTDAQDLLLPGGAATVRELRWDDWGYFDLLAYQPLDEREELPRCPSMGLLGRGSLEGPFVAFQLRRERDPAVKAVVLETGAGATAGWAICGPDPRWFRSVSLLDIHAHPHYHHELPRLVKALELPDGPVHAVLTEPRGPNAAALAAAGFAPEASLGSWLFDGTRRRDTLIWVRK